jgi:uncharacterized protein (TIGR02284 family)
LKTVNDSNIQNDLEELAALQMDSVNGFKQVLQKEFEKSLSDFFNQCLIVSQQMLDELNAEILNLGGDPKKKGTIKGAINHLWMNLKSETVLCDLKCVLKNIELCESINIDRYQQVIADTSDERIKSQLKRQLETLTQRLRKISSMTELY